MARLTGPPRALLEELVEIGGRYVSKTYAPGNRLVELGLAERIDQRYGSVLRPTPAGRQALKDNTHE